MTSTKTLGLTRPTCLNIWLIKTKICLFVFNLLSCRELSNIDEKDLVRDNVSTRTICSFLQELGKLLPAEILPYISLLLSRMDEEVCFPSIIFRDIRFVLS